MMFLALPLSLLISFVLSFLLSETFCTCFARKVCIFESCHVLPRYVHDTRGIGLFFSLYEWNDGIKTSKNSKQNSWSLFLWQKISISFVIICLCHLPQQPFQCYHSHRWTFSVRTHDLSHNLLLLVCFAGASIFCKLSAIFYFILEFSHPFRGFVLRNNNVQIVPVIPFTLQSFSTIYLVCVTNEN